MLHARGVEDLLGYVGHVLGCLPTDSMVLVTVLGPRLRAVVRVDLPQALPAEAGPGWAEAVAGVATRDRGADGVLVLALQDGGADATGPDDGPPWWDDLRRALADHGLPAREAWAVGDARARAWRVDGPHPGPAPVVPVDPASSPLSLHLISRGSVWDLRSGHGRVPTPGEVDAAEAEAWRSAVPAPGALEGRDDWLVAWEPVLEGEPVLGPPADDTLLRRLGAPLVRPAWRDALLLSAAVGDRWGGLRAAERAAVLTGTHARPPRWRRMDRLWEACRRIAGAAPAEAAAQALAVAAWVAWTRGEGSAAGAHLDAARAADPRDGLAEVLHRVVSSGAVCDWAADPGRCWRP